KVGVGPPSRLHSKLLPVSLELKVKLALLLLLGLLGLVSIVVFGAVVSLVKVTVAGVAPLPAASLLGTRTEGLPPLGGLVRAAVTPSVALLKVPSEALIAVPAPSAPAVSMKYSAATTLLLPLETSLMDALIAGAALAGLGVTVTADAVGPVVSLLIV